jgi:hypothetical protein
MSKKVKIERKLNVGNSKTLKNEGLDEIQDRDTKIIVTSKKIIKNKDDSYNYKQKIDKEIKTGYQASKKQYDKAFL